MSDIPKARKILQDVLDRAMDSPRDIQTGILEALELMRRNDGQRALPRSEKLNRWQAAKCRELRDRGVRLHEIGSRFGVSQSAVQNALGTRVR